jgi:hypothetical protein
MIFMTRSANPAREGFLAIAHRDKIFFSELKDKSMSFLFSSTKLLLEKTYSICVGWTLS